MYKSLQDALREIINRYSRENESNTPDYILAKFMNECLVAFEEATKDRDKWYGIKPVPGVSPSEWIKQRGFPEPTDKEKAANLDYNLTARDMEVRDGKGE